MKAQKTQSLTQSETHPQQVWQTLAVAQQEVVFQTIVRVCHSIIQTKDQGEADEPKPNP
jgi:hypothetical protein